MLYDFKYARALGKLGLSRGFIDQWDQKLILDHAARSRRMRRNPIEAAVAMYQILMPGKVKESPAIFTPIVSVAQLQIMKWVHQGKLDAEFAGNSIAKVLESLGQDHEEDA